MSSISMSEKLKTAVIGLGKIASLHAKGLKNSEFSDFRAVLSRNMDKARRFAAEFDVSPYDNFQEMVKKEGIEAAVICTPHPYHAQPVIELAKLGVHSLVEKPLASSLSDCDKMIEASEKYHVTIGVVSQRRFYEPVKRMRKAIDDGKIGMPALGHAIMLGWRDKAYYGSDPWRGKWDTEGGGVLVNQAPHQLDVFQWLMGGEISEIYGVHENINHPYIEVEDTALAIIKFKNNVWGNIVLSNSQKPGIYGKVHVHGKNGASVGAQIEGGAMFIAGQSDVQEAPYNDIWTIPGEESMLQNWKKADEDFFKKIKASEYYIQLQDENFCKAILHKQKPVITAKEARVTVEIFTAIYQSNKLKKPISFPL